MSEEIALRPLTLEDIDDTYCSWYQNSDGHLDFFTGSGRTFNKEILKDDFQKGRDSGSWFYFIAEDLTSKERIGNVKIGPIDKKNKTSDLVCLVGNRKFVGKGMASKIISMANKIAFEKFDLRRLHGGMYSTNVASIKAYVRAGWEIEGVFKGYYLFNCQPVDRICVCCLNPTYFPDANE